MRIVAIQVTDGTIAVLSVRAAGLGVAQSVWSGVSVFVSFAWGKSYFREPINNLPLSLVVCPACPKEMDERLRRQAPAHICCWQFIHFQPC